MKEYNRANIPLAQELRRNMTPWERTLWYQFLSKYPVRFQRQKAIGDFIVDFYCAKAKLAIELDGGGHYTDEQMKKDALRTQKLQDMGIRVVRVCNMDIDKNFRGVCAFLDNEIQSSLPQSAALTAPSSEGASQKAHRTIFALGFFDGVHLGHQALLWECCRMAREMDAAPCAITFCQHPQTLFTASPPKLISRNADRLALLKQYGMTQVVSYPVTVETMSMPWQAFLGQLTEKGAVGFVCGEDFRFGHRGAGTAEILLQYCRENGLSCTVVPQRMLDGSAVSSTRIRSLLEQGDVENANRLLGHPHILSGQVVAGRQLGRTIGIPTANIRIPEEVVVPKHGVYACTASFDGKAYSAVTNVGSRPTVDGHQLRTESWLLGFEGDLYGKEVTLHFHKFLRPERKFPDLEELRRQIQKDAIQAQEFFDNK